MMRDMGKHFRYLANRTDLWAWKVREPTLRVISEKVEEEEEVVGDNRERSKPR